MADIRWAWAGVGLILIIGAGWAQADERQAGGGSQQHLLTIPRIAQAPEIDGRIGAGEWSEAAATTGFFRSDTMFASRVQPVVWAGYDQKAIYVAFISPIPRGSELVATVKGTGGVVSSDDDVEVLLQPRVTEPAVFHVLASPAGGYAVFVGDKPSNSPISYKTVATAEQWVAEVAIPFESIGVAVPEEGAVWGVNFCRGHAKPRQWTSWAPAVIFNDPATFGRLRFGGAGASVQVTSMGKPLIGQLEIEGTLRAGSGQFELCAGAGPREALRIDSSDPAMMHEAGRSQADLLGAETRRIELSKGVGPLSYRKTMPPKPARVIWEVRALPEGAAVQRHYVDIDPLPPFSMELHSSPKRGTIEVLVDAQRSYSPDLPMAGSISFRNSNAQAAPISRALAFEREVGKAAFPLKDLAEGEYSVEASVTVDGRTSTAAQKFLRAGEVPPAYSKLGYEPEVPAPWTPVTVEANQVGVWNRSIEFGGHGLPSAMTSAGLSILSRPMALKAFAEGRELTATVGQAQSKKLSEGAAETTGSVTFPGLTVRTRSRTEFDGCIKVEMEVTAAEGSPDRLDLEVPLSADFARLIHSHAMSWGGTDSGSIPVGNGVVWSKVFNPIIWLGNTHAGLCWFAASQRGWVIASPEAPSEEIVRSGNEVLLRIHLADRALPAGKARQIVFGLQATPVKPLRPDWRLKDRYGRHPLAPPELLMNSVFFEGTGKWWGWPEPKSDEAVKKMEEDLAAGRIPKQPGREPITWAKIKESRDQVHADGGRTFWYANVQMLGMTSPWFHTYGEDWNLTYGLGYENAADEFWNAKGVCPASEWQDLYIGTIATSSLPRYDFDGVYIDLFLPWKCSNAIHGCGYIDDDGKRQAEYTIWPMREQMKRLYRVVHARKNGSIIGHLSAAFIPAIHGFVDSALNGEQYWTYFQTQGGVDYHEVLPLDKCQAEVSGRQWGWAPIFLPEFKSSAGPTSREMLSLVLLHDSLVVPSYMDIHETNDANAILFKLGFVRSRFIGYYDDPPPARTDHAEALVSAYAGAGGDARRAILIITNHGSQAGTFTVTPDARALGLPQGVWAATEHADLKTSRELACKEGAFSIAIPAKDFRIVSIESRAGQP